MLRTVLAPTVFEGSSGVQVEPLSHGLHSFRAPVWGQKWNVRIKGDPVEADETVWFRWLKTTTKQESVRGIAKTVGVSHTTVARWLERGVPAEKVWELTVRFHGDPILALIVLDRITPEQVPLLNYAAIVEYAPAQVLTAEIHERTVQALKDWPELDPRREAVAV